MANERKFIHDLATPLGVIVLTLEIVQDMTQAAREADPALDRQIKKAMDQAAKMTQMLKDRRQYLIDMGYPSAAEEAAKAAAAAASGSSANAAAIPDPQKKPEKKSA